MGEEQLGGASADAQSYWQGRFAACTFVGDFLGIGRTRDTTPVKIGSYEIDIKSGWKSYEPSEEGYEYYHYGSGTTFLMLGAYPVEDMPSSRILQRAMLKQVLASVSSGILSSGNSLSDDDYISLDNDRGTGIYCVAPMLGHDVVIWTYYSADAPTEILCAIYADFNDLGDGVDLLTVIARSAHTSPAPLLLSAEGRFLCFREIRD